MKTNITTGALIVALGFLTNNPITAQEPPPPQVAPHQPPHPRPGSPAPGPAHPVPAPPEAPFGGYSGGGGGGGGYGGGGGGGGGYGGGGRVFIAGPRQLDFDRMGEGPSPALVIGAFGASELNPKTVDILGEDLAIMSRIFDKALAQEQGEDAAPTAMNIPIYTLGAGRSFRSIYLDGYGVLFTLNVRFPLVAPPSVPDEAKAKPPTSSIWEQTKRELFNSPEAPGNLKAAPPSPREPYDERKVQKLKEALIEALKNATNIRNLKADDAIVVAVVGAGNVFKGPDMAGAMPAFLGPSEEMMRRYGLMMQQVSKTPKTLISMEPADRSISVLTIRVKKSAVDEFAQGKLTLDEFRQRASIFVY